MPTDLSGDQRSFAVTPIRSATPSGSGTPKQGPMEMPDPAELAPDN